MRARASRALLAPAGNCRCAIAGAGGASRATRKLPLSRVDAGVSATGYFISSCSQPPQTKPISASRTNQRAIRGKLSMPTFRRIPNEPRPQRISLGGREIEARGLASGFWSDLYYRSMTVSWPAFFAGAAAIFAGSQRRLRGRLSSWATDPSRTPFRAVSWTFCISPSRRWRPWATATCIHRPTTAIWSRRWKSSPACPSWR